MATALHISTTRELDARRPAIRSTIERLQERLNALSDDELETVLESIANALERPEDPSPSGIAAVFAESVSRAQQVEEEVELLMRSFERRRELLASSLTAPQVARLLNTTRQTPHDRVRAGTLVAAMDRGIWRFPTWQFDPDGPDGVIPGLPDVIRALDVPPLAKISWLTRPNQAFDGRSPLALLKSGQVDRVVKQARGVGVAGGGGHWTATSGSLAEPAHHRDSVRLTTGSHLRSNAPERDRADISRERSSDALRSPPRTRN